MHTGKREEIQSPLNTLTQTPSIPRPPPATESSTVHRGRWQWNIQKTHAGEGSALWSVLDAVVEMPELSWGHSSYCYTPFTKRCALL